jgi:hypothetical protein
MVWLSRRAPAASSMCMCGVEIEEKAEKSTIPRADGRIAQSQSSSHADVSSPPMGSASAALLILPAGVAFRPRPASLVNCASLCWTPGKPRCSSKGPVAAHNSRKEQLRSRPRPRLRFAGCYLGARKGPVAAHNSRKEQLRYVSATQAPFCWLLLRSPQRAGSGPQFAKGTTPLATATQAPFCGLLLRSPQRAGSGPQFPKGTIRSRPRPRLRFAGCYLGARKGPVAAHNSRKEQLRYVSATQAPFCGLLLRSPQRAGSGPQFAKGTTPLRGRDPGSVLRAVT